MYKKVYHSVVKTYKDSYKSRIMSRVPCSDVFLIKCLIQKKKKKKKKKKKRERERERMVLFSVLVRFTL